MSNLTLDRPVLARTTPVRDLPALAAAIGAYVDHDSRRAGALLGACTGTSTAVGGYTGTRTAAVGSYVRTQR